MEITKKCEVCGNDFNAKSNKAQFCSNACRVQSHRKHKKSNYSQSNYSAGNQISDKSWQIEIMITTFQNSLTKLSNDFYSIYPMIIESQIIKNKYESFIQSDIINSSKIENLEENIEILERKLKITIQQIKKLKIYMQKKND